MNMLLRRRLEPSIESLDIRDPRYQKLLVNSVLFGSALLTTFLSMLVILNWKLFGNPTLVPLLLPLTVNLLAVGAAGLLAKVDRAAIAGRFLEAGAILAISIAIWMFNGVSGSLPALYVVPIMLAGLRRGLAECLLVGISSVVAFLLVVVVQFQVTHGAPMIVATSTMSNGVIVVGYVAILGLVTYIVGMAARTIEATAGQARNWATEIVGVNNQLLDKNSQQIQLSHDLTAAASNLSAMSQQQASGSTQQASAMSEVTSTIEELGYTARQIAQSCEQVSDAAISTLENLSSGQSAVDESITAMDRIKTKVQDVATRILNLGERSQQIGDIIDIIDGIADETHLLALNAAIEAAGAGEHGRRFSVVAAEVKNLANRAITAAKEVKSVIAEIQSATSSAVMATEEGVKEVDRGAELVTRSGTVMDNIVMIAERTVQSAMEIALATSQQQSASEQVVETMREVAEVSRQGAQSSRHMAEAATTLTRVAERLNGLTGV
ncbi:MAG: methyl-accepting chemotaxis protein [Herpetosiphon sp.]